MCAQPRSSAGQVFEGQVDACLKIAHALRSSGRAVLHIHEGSTAKQVCAPFTFNGLLTLLILPI